MQLTYSGQKNKRAELVMDVVAAILLGVTAVSLLISAFQLSWSPDQAFRGGPATGLVSVWDQIAEYMGRSQYVILPRFAAGMSAAGELLPQGTFLTILGILATLVSFLIIMSRLRPLLLILVVPWFALMFLTGVVPGVFASLGFVFALACAWAFMGTEASAAGPMLLVPLAALVLSIGTCLGVDQATHFAPLPAVQRANTFAEQILHKRYGTGALANGELSSLSGKELAGKRGEIDEIRATLTGGKDKTAAALEIRGRDRKPCYLRGFVGERYTGTSWEPLKDSVYYQQRDDLYWLNQQGFDGLSQMAAAAELTGMSPEPGNLSIRVKKADKSLVYVPYEITGTDRKIPAGTNNYAGSFLGSGKLFGSGEYKFTVTPGLSGEWTDWVGRLYSHRNKAELAQYFLNESHYNTWCYEHDTQISQKLTDLIYAEIGSPGDLSKDHAPYKSSIEKVTSYLRDNYIYSDSFRKVNSKQDFLEEFVKQKKGSDIHFATMACEMFRYFGIPARYVEGYLLTPAAAEKAGAATLGQSHQHAWPEIYIDGFGWVPIEVTPYYQGIMPEADMTKGLQAIAYESQDLNQTQPIPNEITEDEPAPDYSRQVKKILIILLLVILALILLFLLYRLGRRLWKEYYRRKEFRDPDPRRGICAMYAYMQEGGIPISETAEIIGNVASFSPHPVEERHRTIMKKELEIGIYEKKLYEEAHRRDIIDRISDGFGRLRQRFGKWREEH